MPKPRGGIHAGASGGSGVVRKGGEVGVVVWGVNLPRSAWCGAKARDRGGWRGVVWRGVASKGVARKRAVRCGAKLRRWFRRRRQIPAQPRRAFRTERLARCARARRSPRTSEQRLRLCTCQTAANGSGQMLAVSRAGPTMHAPHANGGRREARMHGLAVVVVATRNMCGVEAWACERVVARARARARVERGAKRKGPTHLRGVEGHVGSAGGARCRDAVSPGR